MSTETLILPLSYLPRVEYFSLIASKKTVYFSTNEIYSKQTFRNRAIICGANGIQTLSVPVTRPNGRNSTSYEVEISYVENWVKDHLKSLEAAYNRSPYFEFYIDELSQILNKHHLLLKDLNFDVAKWLIRRLNLETQIKLCEEEIPLESKKLLDPKIKSDYNPIRYIQSFEEKHGFQGNLSVVDLLFHEGPNGVSFLK